MIIRCYGARGSIPVSGEDYLSYGGDTTCLEIRTRNDEIIIVDAGSGIRRLGNRLLEEGRFDYHVIFTHSHWDHILGFPFFKPIYRKKTTLSLMGCDVAQGNIHKLLTKTMSPPYFPVPFERLEADVRYSGTCRESFQIDSVEVFPIHLSHPNMGLGYKFVENGRTFVFLTDNELGYTHSGGRTFEEYVEFSRGADLLIHDAEYTPEQYRTMKTWGHSTYEEALELAMSARVARFGLFHHNQDRSDTDQERIVRKCVDTLGERKIDMECLSHTQTSEMEI